MTTQLESIPGHLGKLRTDLIDQGYSESEAFQIVLDLIRRGDSPQALFDQ